jgi:putative copper resistance protein D
LVAVLVALTSSLEGYADQLFSVHVVQHTLLSMVAPPLIALGAPITLALRATAPATGRRIVRVVRSRPIEVLGHPALAWLLFTFTLYGLYFTSLFDLSLRNQVVHQAVHAHFLAVGLLFWWPVVGLDPTRWKMTHPARLLYFLLMLPFHAFLGLSIMSSDVLMAPSLGLVARTWGPSPVADQHAAGALLWASGELLTVAAAMGIMVAWMAHEERAGERADRRLDRVPITRASSP